MTDAPVKAAFAGTGTLLGSVGGSFVRRLLDPGADEKLIEDALRLEAEVWEQRGFNSGGSIDDYRVLNAQSRVFAAFDSQGSCVGSCRVFVRGPEPLPFLGMPFFHEFLRSVLEQDVADGVLEEVGTSAVSPRARHIPVVRQLWKMAYRDAVDRGVKRWGIIMEPRRVTAMNRRYGFSFRQVGEERYYQGGYCAAHVLDLRAVAVHMAKVRPAEYQWFTGSP